MKNINHSDPEKVLEIIKELENLAGLPEFDLERREDIKVQIRVDEKISPAKFRPDPLVSGGYVANSLTVKAMRADIFVLGETTEDLSSYHQCVCGEELDVQFWRLCPHCGRQIEI